MNTVRPGFQPARMIRLIQSAIDRCRLDLTGLVVLTEAATGAYVVTPVIAAMAGAAKVYAIAKGSKYGSRAEVIRQTNAAAKLARVQGRIQIVARATKKIVSQADLVTNSGHVRPLDALKIAWMMPTAVIPLMYEAWEFRAEDLDAEACRNKGVRVVGTNEQHPDIDVFGYLGELAMKQLMDAGISAYRSNILLLSDNDFCPYISRTLVRAGASVDIGTDLEAHASTKSYDAILLAMRPCGKSCLSAKDIRQVGRRWPGTVLVQFFGDLDRRSCRQAGISLWPESAPGQGHMSILPAAVGPESTIRLQTGGLKAGEATWRNDAKNMRKYARAVVGGRFR